ncbi:MAG: hydrogenase maturation protease [Chloroflexi bacterium]|nr:hydrogenase maturation protease [Chloroflexota bacterium]
MRTLIVGYGNPYRRDDGVGYHVLKAIAVQLGRPPLALDEDGLDALGEEVDLVCLPQLLPELAETLAAYGRVIFVDAHTGAYAEDLRCVAVEPRYTPSAFTHHMTPETLLGLALAFSEAVPPAYLFSVRGYDFDFGVELSEETERLAEKVVERVMNMVAQLGG